jgi:hypothetical protein
MILDKKNSFLKFPFQECFSKYSNNLVLKCVVAHDNETTWAWCFLWGKNFLPTDLAWFLRLSISLWVSFVKLCCWLYCMQILDVCAKGKFLDLEHIVFENAISFPKWFLKLKIYTSTRSIWGFRFFFNA